MDTYAYDHGLPCRNPNCKSHGKPHPNCQCYGGGGAGDYLAKGGVVNFCASGMPHLPHCEYFAEGGEVKPMVPHENHAAAHHGLLGLLTNVGQAQMSEPDKASRTIEKVKLQMNEGKHEKAAGTLDGHPLMGASLKSHQPMIMGKLAGPIQDREAHPEALKGAAEYLSHIGRGHSNLENSIGGMFGPNERMKPDTNSRMSLQKRLDEFKETPAKLLEVGGNLGHYLPDEAEKLGALAQASTEYLANLKPNPPQGGPLDPPQKVDKVSQARYDRQVDIAQQPLSILQHVKDGTLQPEDMTTLKMIYPGLMQSMVEKAGAELIKAKDSGKLIPYKQQRSLAMLLGQPLSNAMTQTSMQAIIKSQAQQQQNNQVKAKGKATDVELKQINKVNKLYATPIESSQIDKKS